MNVRPFYDSLIDRLDAAVLTGSTRNHNPNHGSQPRDKAGRWAGAGHAALKSSGAVRKAMSTPEGAGVLHKILSGLKAGGRAAGRVAKHIGHGAMIAGHAMWQGVKEGAKFAATAIAANESVTANDAVDDLEREIAAELGDAEVDHLIAELNRYFLRESVTAGAGTPTQHGRGDVNVQR